MKRFLSAIFLFALMLFVVSPISTAAEFDGLDYNLNYESITGNLDLYFDVAGEITDLEFQFDIEENMPSTVITERIECVCDPDGPDYDPQLCVVLNRIFTTEVLAWLDAQWNLHYSTALEVLPFAIQTRQIPWPADIFGSIFMVDYQIDWPCSWDTQSGEFINIPLAYTYSIPLTEFITLDTSFALAGNGVVDRDANYSLGGAFDFDSGLTFIGPDLFLDIQFGLIANYVDLS
ncbi:hypothetical protein K8T06_06115 [bacterium]|nr:hypothetical protein [bacterium]